MKVSEWCVLSNDVIGGWVWEIHDCGVVIDTHIYYIYDGRGCGWMPNTFAPRAYSDVVKDRVDRLRVQYDGDAADVKEWHAMVDIMNEDATESFLDRYGRVGEIPYVVSGVGRDNGLDPTDE